jgi:NAD(P)-dependent dehydrogenase (short-subunit alcohol dehydrogenase family)
MIKATKPVVIITGVSGGIGLAAAKLFASKGWIVVGSVRNRVRGAALRGLQIDLQIADMIKPRDLERLVQTAWRTYGRLDALVCNAGYGLIGPIDTLEYAQMTDQMVVNVLAPAALVGYTVPLMKRQKSGVIIGVSSLVGRTGLPGYSMYAASKFGLEGLFESLAMELITTGIRVKLIEPSGVNTGFWDGLKRGSARTWNGQEIGPAAEVNLGGGSSFARGLSAEQVAAALYRAATDGNRQLRYPLGQTRWAGYAKRLLPDRLLLKLIRRIVSGKK